MLTNTRNWIMAGMIGLLVACGGGVAATAPRRGTRPAPRPADTTRTHSADAGPDALRRGDRVERVYHQRHYSRRRPARSEIPVIRWQQ